MTENQLTCALIQQQPANTPEATRDATIAQVRSMAAAGARLIVLQELFATRYFCQAQDAANFAFAEPVEGPTVEAFRVLSGELSVVIVVPFFEVRSHGVHHNTVAVVDNGDVAGIYRKMHIPDDPGFNEKFYFAPGDLGFTPINTSVGSLGVLICWDQWFPEAARCMALNGAQILIYPTAIGWNPNDDHQTRLAELDAWLTVQRSHAITNSLPLLACNRVGLETENDTQSIQFWGNSFACDAQGQLLKTANNEVAENVLVELDLNQGRRLQWLWPFFRDRRIDAYGELVRRSSK